MFGPDKMGDIAGETFDVVNLRYISNQYRKSKTKDTENTVNQSKLEVIRVADAKRGKTRANDSQLAMVTNQNSK